MPIQLIDISSSHSTLLFFLAWQKNVFPPLLPIVPTPCGTFYKGPTKPLLSIGKSIIKDSVNMNVARIGTYFVQKSMMLKLCFWSWYSSSQLVSKGAIPILLTSILTVLSWMCYWIQSFYQREKQVDQTNSCKKRTALKKEGKLLTWCANTSWGKKGKEKRSC